MTNPEVCDFCDTANLESRTIRAGKQCLSIVSSPWFRARQCLVMPKRHVREIVELEPEESIEIMAELGRLASLLDKGYGTHIFQKFDPLQAENDIKRNHLHFHVFPRLKNELGLFPTPIPNSFEGFVRPDDEVIASLVKRLR